jgi:hypothetical protein
MRALRTRYMKYPVAMTLKANPAPDILENKQVMKT